MHNNCLDHLSLIDLPFCVMASGTKKRKTELEQLLEYRSSCRLPPRRTRRLISNPAINDDDTEGTEDTISTEGCDESAINRDSLGIETVESTEKVATIQELVRDQTKAEALHRLLSAAKDLGLPNDQQSQRMKALERDVNAQRHVITELRREAEEREAASREDQLMIEDLQHKLKVETELHDAVRVRLAAIIGDLMQPDTATSETRDPM